MLSRAILAFFITTTALLPCGPGLPDPLRLFRPVELRRAFLAAADQNNPYYQELDRLSGSCNVKAFDSREANLVHWQKSLKTRLDLPALQKLVYEIPAETIAGALAGQPAGWLTGLLQNDRTSLDYLLFAKKLEPYVRGNNDSWQPEPARPGREEVKPLVDEALKRKGKVERATGIRYLFQAMRLVHYSGDYATVESLSNQLPADFSTRDPLYAEIKHLEAGALLKQKKTSQGLLLLAGLVAADPVQIGRVQTDFLLYHGQGDAFARALSTADPRIRLSLRLLHFFANPAPGLPALKAASTERPRDPLLDFMLLREIDRLEDRLEEHLFYPENARRSQNPSVSLWQRIFSRLMVFFGGSLAAAAPAEELRYIRELDLFIGASIDAGIAPSPDLWHLSRAFLAYLSDDPLKSQRLLQDSLIQKSAKDFVKKQSQRLQLLSHVAAAKDVGPGLKKEIISHYPAFLPGADGDSCPLNDRGARVRLHQSMSALHKKNKESGYALLWEMDGARMDRSAPVNTYPLQALQEAIALLDEDKSPYMQKLRQLSGLTGTALRLRLGGRLLKDNQASAAIKTLTSLEPSELDRMYRSEQIQAGPFSHPLTERFSAGESAMSWNTLKIARKKVEHEEQIKTGQNAANAHYRLGLLEYNMSQAGQWWSAVDTDWSAYYEYSDRAGDPQLLRAMEHFRQALKHRPDRETEAAARYMLALVSYLDETPTGWEAEDRGLKLTAVQKEEFAQIQSLENTQFFREVIRDCSYYRKYRK
ncbi:MAG: hypothetical protein HS115_02730 [Spirochaetales bacterium]|nr:hypothetical protein [Spirochaetales bacterium]